MTDPALTRGVAWLQAQIQTSGQLGTETASTALPMQVRAETASALKTYAQTLPAALLAATQAASASTTEYLARNALTLQAYASANAPTLDALAELQNTDGGYGATAGLPSNPQDTAWALLALAANRANTVATTQALTWLTSNQQTSGQWSLAPDGDAIVTTALAAQALTAYRQQASAQAALTHARAWLLAQRDTTTQTWVDDLRTAQALLAVLPGLTSATDVQAAVNALRVGQGADGSWGGDPYTTALALRALWLATQPVTNPDLASVTGQVLNDKGVSLAGAVVTLSPNGAQVVTSTDGKFSFTQLQASQQVLSVQATGFRVLTSTLNLQPGQQLDLGTLQLLPDSTSVPAVLKVRTDQPVYGPNAPVGLGAGITNLGAYAVAFNLDLSIQDSQGVQVIDFGNKALGTFAPGATQSSAQPWNTGNYQVGNYVLLGRLFDQAGNIVAQDQAPFAIVATLDPSVCTATLTVSADKSQYAPSDIVVLNDLVSNLAANAVINDASVSLTVTDPQGSVVFTHQYDLGQLPAGGLQSLKTQQVLQGAQLGTYTVQAMLSGSVAGVPTDLARASASYTVVAGGQNGSVTGLAGTVTIASASLQVGQSESRSDTIRNTASVDFAGLKVMRVIAALSNGKVVQDLEQVIDLPSGGQQSWPLTAIDTGTLQKGIYSVLLLAEVNGQLVTLDQTAFNLTTSGVVGISTPTPVPTLGTLALMLMGLLMALAAARRCGIRRRPTLSEATVQNTQTTGEAR